MAATISHAANSVICQLSDVEGRTAGSQLDIPQDAGPKELSALLNALLNNVMMRGIVCEGLMRCLKLLSVDRTSRIA